MAYNELQKVIETIRQMTQVTVKRGATENEAMVAAEKIAKLLKVYNLSMDKVFLGESKCITGTIQTGRYRRHPIDLCLMAIADFCDCKVWFNRGHKSAKIEGQYKLFGMETDIEMAKYLYSLIMRAMETETENFKASQHYDDPHVRYNSTLAGTRKRLTVSFQKGMSGRVSKRLREMLEQRHQEEEEQSPPILIEQDGISTSTSLVLVKRNKVDEEYEKLGMKLTSCPGSNWSADASAYRAGQAAGDRVNLHRPVHGDVKIQGYLQ